MFKVGEKNMTVDQVLKEYEDEIKKRMYLKD